MDRRRDLARRFAGVGRKNGISGAAAVGAEYGDVTPTFEVVRFTEVAGLSVNGSGRYSQTTRDMVDQDIRTAKAFAAMMERITGGTFLVEFSTENNILEITVRAVGYFSPDQEQEITSRLQGLVMGDV